MLALLAKLQFLLPHYLLSKIIYKIANIRQKTIKNKLILLFIKLYKIKLDQYEINNINNFDNFNHFFIRKLKPELLQKKLSDNTITDINLISPCEGTIASLGSIENNQLYQIKNVKYTLPDLLADKLDLKLADIFKNGSYITLYLAPHNYHRVHMPISAKLIKSVYIPGRLYAVNNTSTKYIKNIFTKNERVINIFEYQKNNQTHYMAIILVGALLVGSIATKHTGIITPPHGQYQSWDYSNQEYYYNKGDELGYFQMGSTVILLFSENYNFDHELHNNKINLFDQIL